MDNNKNIPENKRMSAEEMAKMIARNLNAQRNEDADNDFSADEYETKTYQQAAAKAMERTKTSANGTAVKTHNEDSDEDDRPVKSSKSREKKSSGKGKFIGGFVCALVVIGVVAGAAVYLAGMNSRKGVFLDNTYINGINVSGKTESEAIDLLEKNNALPDSYNIEKLDGKIEKISLSDLGYVDNTEARVNQYYSKQNHYTWFKNLFTRTDFKWNADFKYKKEDLEKIIKEKIVNDKTAVKPENARMTQNDDGTYTVVKEKTGTKINPAKAKDVYKYIEQQIDSGNFNVDISELDCYQKASVTSEKLQPTCDILNNLNSMEINFDFNYTKEKLDSSTIMDWVSLSEDGTSYTVDEDKAMAYVEKLAQKYDTFGKPRKFKTTKKKVITIPAGDGCYGWWIDQTQTRDLIVDTIEAGKSATLTPIYYQNPDSGFTYSCNPEWRTKDKDYSDTYIEIDLSAQHLWYYKNGKLAMQTPIVSGYDGDPQRITPPGVYKLWIKETAKTLTGAVNGQSYASYVDYWNNISTIGIGLHDASWQNGDFNSSKYHTSYGGSHGCINMPFDKAQYVYNNIDYGTPVFIYGK